MIWKRPTLFLAVVLTSAAAEAQYRDGWRMAGANPQRTSWVPEEVRGDLKPLWSAPLEPYVSQKVQVIAADGLLYVATAGGLYALDADTGAQRWLYATALPLGHSPTVVGGVAYVGCFDRKFHAIDAKTGRGLWTYEAGAGFSTNPLVVDGAVYAGCRDQFFYAVDAKTGKELWRFGAGGPVLFSAAWHEGVVFFAANDSHAYALDAKTGRLVWKSAKLPGAGFHSWWPVVYRDRVIFAGSSNYRAAMRPAMDTLFTGLELREVYPDYKTDPGGRPIGPIGQEPGDWAAGSATIDARRILDYFRNKPWRRTYFVLDRATGEERESAPVLWFGTHSGNRYPPVVGSDGVLYQTNNYFSSPWIAGGGICGWKIGTPFLRPVSVAWKAVDEPMAYAAGGDLIYWNLCCNRGTGVIDIAKPTPADWRNRSAEPAHREWTYVGYNHNRVFPQLYGEGWRFNCGAHNDQNPPIPYRGRVYTLRYNAVECFSLEGTLPAVATEDEPVPQRFLARPLDPQGKLPGTALDLYAADGQWPALIETRDLLYRRRKKDSNAYPVCSLAAGDKKRPEAIEIDRAAAPPTVRCRLEGGKTASVQVIARSPSVLFATDESTCRIEGTFTNLAYQSAGGLKVAGAPGALRGADLAEGWLLLWAGAELPRLKPLFALDMPIAEDAWHHTWLRAGMTRFRPILVSLEHKPAASELSEAGLRMSFGRPAGKIVLTPLWGLHNPDPRQGLAWARQLPAGVAERCQRLHAMARALPVGVEDRWTVDPGTGNVTVTSTCGHETITDDWGTQPLRLACLPPALALAAWNGLRVPVDGHVVDLDYALPLGRLGGVAGSQCRAVLPGLARYWREVPRKHTVPDADDPLHDRLIEEVQKIVAAGHLRPGYFSSGIFDGRSANNTGDYTVDYFHNPADTIGTLLRALPLLPGRMQDAVKTYVRQEFAAYPPHTIAHIGWAEGAPREVFDTPPEFEAAKGEYPAGNRTWPNWTLPPQNFYALWQFAAEFGGAKEVFAQCRTRPDLKDGRFPASMPFMLNCHVAGQIGYYRLARLAGVPPAELADRERELARLFVLRAALAKAPESLTRAGYEYGGPRYTVNSFDPAGGDVTLAQVELGSWPLYNFTLPFVELVPELGRFLRDYARAETAAALEDFNRRHPYWFVAKGEDTDGEGTLQPLHDTISAFNAKAQILSETREELQKYVDIPGFERGDLFFLQKLILTLEAPNR